MLILLFRLLYLLLLYFLVFPSLSSTPVYPFPRHRLRFLATTLTAY